jgi:hypothetical protein
MRLKEKTKQKLIKRIKEDVSINNISKEMGLAKSTIYYYYKKIKGRKFKKLNLKPGYSRREGEIVGIFAGDGSQYYNKKHCAYQVNVHFGKKNKDYMEYVKRLYELYFKKKFNITKEERTIKIRTRSKEIYNYFHHYIDFKPQIKHCTVKLKTLDLSMEFKLGFLKGFVDTDGSVLLKKQRKKIRVAFYTTSEALANQIRDILSEIDIKCGVYIRKKEGLKDCYTVQLRQRHVIKFLNVVKPFKMCKLRANSSAR